MPLRVAISLSFSSIFRLAAASSSVRTSSSFLVFSSVALVAMRVARFSTSSA